MLLSPGPTRWLAGSRRLCTGIAAGVLLARAPAPASAQAGGHAPARAQVAGRVLEQQQGAPVAGAVVRITADDTNAATADSADSQGRFTLTLPPGNGPFSLRAERLGYVPLTVTVTADEAAGGAVWRDLRLAVRAVQLPGLAVRQPKPARQRDPGGTPGGREERRLSWSAVVSPTDASDLAGLAAEQPGVYSDENGLSFLAQDPSQTGVTLDGATYGATTLPQEGLASSNVVLSAFDVSRGQYSGGLLEATTLAGTNLFGVALRTRLSPRGLQWQAATGVPARPGASLARAEGGAGGPVLRNHVYWYGAFSITQSSTPLASLESAAPDLLAGWGVNPDSAARLSALLREGRLGPAESALSTMSTTDQATAVLRLDWDVTDRHALMLRLDGRRTDARGLGVDPLSALASGGRAREQSGGIMLQLNSRLGEAATHELRIYRSAESRWARPEWAGPAGTVRVAAANGAGSQVLSFGGSQSDAEQDGDLLEISNQLRVPLGAHELKAGGIASDRRAAIETATNAYGTFQFNSLDDLRLGRPSVYTRTIGSREGEARTRYGALYLGDTWKRGRFETTYGVRLEARGYPGLSDGNVVVEEAFGARSGRVPGEWGVSPRVGWSYDGVTWDLRGGVGEFRGAVPLPAMADLLSQTGRGGQSYLWCVGPAAPAPSWETYAADPATLPDACVGGAGPFAAQTPALTVFSPGFAAPRTWHAAFSALRQISRVKLQVDGTLTRGLSQPAGRDANLAVTPAFALSSEGGRMVFAPAAAIDPASGGVAPGASRRYAQWGAVREVGAWGTSTVAQGTVRLSWFLPRMGMLMSAAYTHTRAWDRVGALPGLGGSAALAGDDPLGLVTAAADRERIHDLQVQWMVMPRPWIRVGLLGRLASGTPFTPRVDGDVNGDGTRNDAAFIFAPGAVADTALSVGMSTLLDAMPGRIRDCLERQMGRVASRNSCRNGWASALDLRAEVQPWRRALERRLSLSLTTGNALGLADQLLHGGDRLHGWGEPAVVDPVLLRVRGFDPAARAFRYEVNPAFGSRSAVRERFRRPFTLTLEGRVVVGEDPANQPLQRRLASTLGARGSSPESLRLELSQRIPNLPAQVASLDSAERLGLSLDQRDRLTTRARAVGEHLAPLVDSLVTALGGGTRAGAGEAREQRRRVTELTAQVQQALDEDLRAVREILTADQWSRLPEAIRVPSRQFIPPRNFGQ